MKGGSVEFAELVTIFIERIELAAAGEGGGPDQHAVIAADADLRQGMLHRIC